ncbi:glutamate mutase L [Lentzea sp. NEAU-D7]|uniref:glutamate mutase L n=1 Tax=Lentzea sp. NEAU-D7 TaxID=2994667 RepID=UPI00224AC538|nr:glutamate mutase L [Lentzea sp. NEAU-D7]MCX2950565.1 glutamate mutase L [Lentzea sp. NEAU-D7]
MILCLDVGSTWTKAALVTPEGELVRTGQHPTTPPEVLRGIDVLRSEVGDGEILACSSAGGGLRLAVVGQERVVSAEAGYRVALSAGAKIVHVSAGPVDVKALRASAPDLVLLVGGTDGGDRKVLLHNAAKLARVAVPIVLAGNVEAQPEAVELLAKRTVVACPNVLPDVGQLAPEPARKAIREAFLQHVIGGKGLSKGPRFRQLVRAVTPDAVLAGVSRLAAQDREGAVLVVDVGGATTDVYSAVSTADSEGLERTVALPPDRRTVEGDLGMRWSAPGVVKEALTERLTTEDLTEEAQKRAENVGWLPDDPSVDVKLASFAAILAVRRHLRQVDGQLGPHGAGLLVLSGGVFRHTPDIGPIVEALRADPVLRPVLKTAEITVDRDYVLAPVGLLAESGRLEAADRLAKRLG